MERNEGVRVWTEASFFCSKSCKAFKQNSFSKSKGNQSGLSVCLMCDKEIK